MVLLPALSLFICVGLAVVTLRRHVARRRPHELVWSATFTTFALAAGCEVAGGLWGWSPTSARVYYLTGATMAVGYLAVGTMFLSVPRPIAFAGLLVVLVQTSAAAILIWRAPVDQQLLESSGWRALEKSGELIALAITINSLGTLVVVGGALVSAWLLSRGSAPGARAAGVATIGLGSLVVAAGGTLTRLGHHEYLYAAMAPGMLMIFSGYLLANSATRAAKSDNRAIFESLDSGSTVVERSM